jgi:2-keto-4-pentenoate hydratase/2-oxohepta-3-ene-1,7-dioic acid hydratase in catechol pathway
MTQGGVVSVADLVSRGPTPQLTMTGIIDDFERLRPGLERRARDGDATPLADVRLRAPLPRPGKILACIANYWEHGALEARPLNMFLKNPDAVIGPGDTIVLPEFTEPWIFMHEAELALVIKGPAKKVKAENWRSAVFGYTGMIDVSARGEGRRTWKAGSWLGKSFDTFAPLGPCLATLDEIPNPNDGSCASGSMGNCGTITTPMTWSTSCRARRVCLDHHDAQLRRCHRLRTNHEGLGPLRTARSSTSRSNTSGACGLTSWIRSGGAGRKAFTWGRIQPTLMPSGAIGRRRRVDILPVVDRWVWAARCFFLLKTAISSEKLTSS